MFSGKEDHLAHCWIGCVLASSCGIEWAYVAGLAKEFLDVLRKLMRMDAGVEERDIWNTWVGGHLGGRFGDCLSLCLTGVEAGEIVPPPGVAGGGGTGGT